MRIVVALAVILGLVVLGFWRARVGQQTSAAASAVALEAAERRSPSREGPEALPPDRASEPVRAPAADGAGAGVAGEGSARVNATPSAGASNRIAIDNTLSKDELRALAMDLSLSVDDRIDAARLLRYGWKGTDPRTSAFVAAMIDMAAYADGEQRGHIWKALDECKDPQLVEPLLQALVGDVDAGARSEAAETLGTFVGEERVRAALELAAERDVDASVRKEARGSLDG